VCWCVHASRGREGDYTFSSHTGGLKGKRSKVVVGIKVTLLPLCPPLFPAHAAKCLNISATGLSSPRLRPKWHHIPYIAHYFGWALVKCHVLYRE
jgi:hypothetical protein